MNNQTILRSRHEGGAMRKRTNRRNGARLALSLALGVVVGELSPLAPQIARADTTWTGATNQDWNTASNWNNGLPGTGNNDAIINTTGNFPILSANGNVSRDIRIGTGSTGRLDQTAGTLNTGNGSWFFLGYLGANATYNLANTAGSGGTLTGFAQGSGSLNVGGATQNGNMFVGLDGGTVSTVNINTSGTLAAGGIYVGANGGSNGTINLDNGTVNASGEVQIGSSFFGNGNIGNLNVSGGTFTADILSVARGGNNAATIQGTATITGGTVNSRRWFTLGFAGNASNNATVTNNGGTINVNTLSGGAGVLEMGVFDATTSNFNQNSGVLTLQNNASISFGNGGNHTGGSIFNQNGGTVTFYSDSGTTVGGSGSVNLGNGNSTGTYVYNLNGGTLTTPSIRKASAGANGTFIFNGGTLKAAASTGTFISGLSAANVGNGGAIIDSNGFNVGVSQALLNGGAGGLTKAGAGNLTLSASNTYTGNTTITGGGVVLSGTGAINATGGITVNGSGAKIVNNSSTGVSPTVTVTSGGVDGSGSFTIVNVASNASNSISNGGGTTAPITIDTLNFAGAGNFSLNVGGTSPEVFVNNLTTNAAGTVLVNASAASWSPGQYDLVLYSTLGGAGFSQIQKGTIAGLSGRQSATLTNPSGFISLVIAGDNPKWTGALNSTWSTAVMSNPKNWQLITNGTPTDYINGDVVLFDDTASNFTVNINGGANVSPSSTTFNNSNNYVVNGPNGIAGTGSLTKNGSGSLTINSPNTYSGGTSLNAGTLNVNNASAIGTGTLAVAGATTIDNTSGSAVTLSTNNAQAWNGDFTFTGSNPLNVGTGAATMSGNRTVTVNASTLSVSNIGQSAAGSSLTKAGAGTMVVGGTSTYSGDTNITGGTLDVTGTLTTSPTLNVSGGGVLKVSGTFSNNLTNIRNGAMNVTGAETTTGDLWVGLGAAGVGNLQVGSGATLNAGVLLIGSSGNPTDVANGSGSLASGGTINTTNWFVVGHSGGLGTTGSFAVNGGTINVNTDSGAGNLEVGTWDPVVATLDINTGSTVRLLNGGEIAMGALAHTGTSTINHNGGTVTLYSDNGTTLGGGRLIMGGTAGFAAASGNYTYNLNGGTLSVGFISSDSAPTATKVFNFNGGTLKANVDHAAFMSNITTANVRNGGAVIDTNGKSVTVATPLTHSNVGGDNAIDGGLSKNGAGTLTISGAATYTGNTVINGGTLRLPSGAAPSAVGVYSFDDLTAGQLAGGTTVANTGTGGAAMNGTVNHADNILDSSNGTAFATTGQFGNALQLDGAGSSVDIANKIVDQSGAGSWTMSAWVKTSTTGSSFVSKNDGNVAWNGGDSVFYLGSNPISGTPGSLPTAARNGGNFVQGDGSVTDDLWHMLTFVDNNGAKTIYVDGVAVTLTQTAFDNADPTTLVRLGYNIDTLSGVDGNVNFAGLLDEVKFFNGALNATQVQQLFASNTVSDSGGSQYLPAATALSMPASGTVLDLNNNNQTIGSLSGVAGSSVALGSGTLSTGGNNASTTYAGDIAGAGGLTKNGTGTFTVSGANTYSGATSVSGGTLRITQSSRSSAALNVADGARAEMTPRSAGVKTLQVGALNLNTSGTLDLADNDLVVDNGSYAVIQAAVFSGFGNPSGPGITSSTSDGSQILALFDNSLIGAGDWNGGAIGANAIVGKYTYFGDANIDGQVTGDDYTVIDANLNTTPAVGLEWLSGDMNLDGSVTGDDYTVIDANLGLGVGNPLSASALGSMPAGSLSAVPEPASLGVLAVAGSLLLGRRRRAGR